MDNYNELSLAQMHKFLADLCIQINELKKAQSSLSEAKSILERMKEENS